MLVLESLQIIASAPMLLFNNLGHSWCNLNGHECWPCHSMPLYRLSCRSYVRLSSFIPIMRTVTFDTRSRHGTYYRQFASNNKFRRTSSGLNHTWGTTTIWWWLCQSCPSQKITAQHAKKAYKNLFPVNE